MEKTAGCTGGTVGNNLLLINKYSPKKLRYAYCYSSCNRPYSLLDNFHLYTAVCTMNGSHENAMCQTSLSHRMVLSDEQSLTIASILIFISPIIAVTNLLLCYSMIKTKQVKILSQRFVLILGLSDIFVGILTCPSLALLFSLFRQKDICWYEKFALFLSHFNTRLSAYVVVLIGIDRYFNIKTEFTRMTYLSKLTKSGKGIGALLAVAMMISAAQSSLTIIDFENHTLPKGISSAVDAIIYFIYFFTYIRLFLRIQKFTKTNSIHIGSSGGRPRYIRKLVKTVLFLILTVGLCYMPFVVMSFVVTYIKYNSKQPVSHTVRFLHYLTTILILLNSLFNTFVILYRNSVLKKYIMDNVFHMKPQDQSVANLSARPAISNVSETFMRNLQN